MNNLGPSLEKIFGVLLILFGSLFIAIYIMVMNDEGEFTGSVISDFLIVIVIGILPLYFGFKLYNGFDILRMKSRSSFIFESIFKSSKNYKNQSSSFSKEKNQKNQKNISE